MKNKIKTDKSLDFVYEKKKTFHERKKNWIKVSRIWGVEYSWWLQADYVHFSRLSFFSLSTSLINELSHSTPTPQKIRSIFLKLTIFISIRKRSWQPPPNTQPLLIKCLKKIGNLIVYFSKMVWVTNKSRERESENFYFEINLNPLWRNIVASEEKKLSLHVQFYTELKGTLLPNENKNHPLIICNIWSFFLSLWKI